MFFGLAKCAKNVEMCQHGTEFFILSQKGNCSYRASPEDLLTRQSSVNVNFAWRLLHKLNRESVISNWNEILYASKDCLACVVGCTVINFYHLHLEI